MRKYYNQQQKEKYINSNLNRNQFLNKTNFNTFVRVSKVEEALGKDACNFETDEIISWYKSLLTSSLESLMSNNSQLKIYTDWCVQNGYTRDYQNHYSEITTEMLNDCLNEELVNKSILTRKELLYIIRKEVPDNPADCFLLLALFEGICGKEMSDLSMLEYKDFDFNKKSVHLYSGKTIKVSNELLHYAKETQETDEYYPYGSDRSFYFKSKNEDKRLLRSLYNATSTDDLTALRKRLYNKLIRMRNYTNIAAISQKSLINSGRIDYINKEMSKGMEFEVVIELEDYKAKYGELIAKRRWLLQYAKFIK